MTATTEFRRTENARERTIEAIYTFPELEHANTYGERHVPGLVISVHHDRERKAFVRTIKRVQFTPHGYVWAAMIGRDTDACPLPWWTITERVARYSDKALKSAYDAARAAIDGENMTALLDWAQRVERD